MRIVLRTDVVGLGKRGDLINVSDGYGRNYLLPQGMAILAGEGIVAQATAMRKARDLRDQKAKSSAEELAGRLVSTIVSVSAKAGKEGKLFGSVSSHDLIEAVRSQTGIELDRKSLHLDEPIKSVGTHHVPVKLHSEVEIQLNVEVGAEAE